MRNANTVIVNGCRTSTAKLVVAAIQASLPSLDETPAVDCILYGLQISGEKSLSCGRIYAVADAQSTSQSTQSSAQRALCLQVANFTFHKQEFWLDTWAAQLQQVSVCKCILALTKYAGHTLSIFSEHNVALLKLNPSAGSLAGGDAVAHLRSTGVQKAQQASLLARFCLLQTIR